MNDIHIHRTHALGLERAREIAREWAAESADKHDLVCVFNPGETSDSIGFKRIGVTGHLIVSHDHFELTARLGFLLSGFRWAVQAEVEKKLDAMLAREASRPR